MSVDAVVIGAGIEPGFYEVLPGGSESCPVFSSTVQAAVMRDEELSAGEKVDIIQIGSEFGIAKKVHQIKGCLQVPEESKNGIMSASPAMAAASYIGQLANNFVKPYSTGTVKAVSSSTLSVEYDDKTESLFLVPGLSISDFSVDDLVFVNKWEYNAPLVMGKWQTAAALELIEYYLNDTLLAATDIHWFPTNLATDHPIFYYVSEPYPVLYMSFSLPEKTIVQEVAFAEAWYGDTRPPMIAFGVYPYYGFKQYGFYDLNGGGGTYKLKIKSKRLPSTMNLFLGAVKDEAAVATFNYVPILPNQTTEISVTRSAKNTQLYLFAYGILK